MSTSEQAASSVILVRPTGFGYDPETAASNSFQQRVEDADIRMHAASEFDALLEALRQCGIGVTVLDPVEPNAPNAVFPNNWFSTHADGTLVVYPMHTPSRRRERDPALRERLKEAGFQVLNVHDLSAWEDRGHSLEGTGSLVLDRPGRLAYACLSPRTLEPALHRWCELMDHTPVSFTATMDGSFDGQPVYHTNVVMSIGTRFAVVCLEAMPYPGERAELVRELERSGRQVIPIGLEQMHRYVGNMLELRGDPARAGIPHRGACILLSETAFQALQPDQRMALQEHGQLVPVPIPTIEAVGGGSVRCMLAENFLGRHC